MESTNMRNVLWIVVVVLLGVAAQAAEIFTPVFNGKDLAGWSGNTDVFRVEDGAIVGGSLKQPLGKNQFLTSEKRYGNFELHLKFRVQGDLSKANAGVQIRSERIPNHHEMVGYQADIGAGFWGSLYDESRRNKVLAGLEMPKVLPALKLDGWNDYRIRCEGKRIQLWINGLQTVDYTESDDSIPQEGLIGLQVHAGPPMEIRYKDIEIAELPER